MLYVPVLSWAQNWLIYQIPYPVWILDTRINRISGNSYHRNQLFWENMHLNTRAVDPDPHSCSFVFARRFLHLKTKKIIFMLFIKSIFAQIKLKWHWKSTSILNIFSIATSTTVQVTKLKRSNILLLNKKKIQKY